MNIPPQKPTKVEPYYISSNLNYKPRKDLELYETKQIESTFIEIVNTKGKNTVIGCIYKHTISQEEFNKIIKPIIFKFKTENKPIRRL